MAKKNEGGGDLWAFSLHIPWPNLCELKSQESHASVALKGILNVTGLLSLERESGVSSLSSVERDIDPSPPQNSIAAGRESQEVDILPSEMTGDCLTQKVTKSSEWYPSPQVMSRSPRQSMLQKDNLLSLRFTQDCNQCLIHTALKFNIV